MRTIITFIFLILILIFQLSFLPNTGIFKYFNLVFCYLVIYRFITKKFFLLYTISAGLLLDLFSIFPNGYYLILYLLFGLTIDWLFSRVSVVSPLINAAIAPISGLIYQIEFLILNQILYWSKMIRWSIIFNLSYFYQVAIFIIFNSLIIFLFNQIWLIRLKPKASI